jgi:hypothetical protein
MGMPNYEILAAVAAVFLVMFLVAALWAGFTVKRRKAQGRSAFPVIAVLVLVTGALYAAIAYWPPYPHGMFSGVLTLAFTTFMGAVIGGFSAIRRRLESSIEKEEPSGQSLLGDILNPDTSDERLAELYDDESLRGYTYY